MNGVIVADKPAGWTSHDVVAKVKKTLGARKVGHLGTLDPNATGVLPLVVNNATRYARFMDGGVKGYDAVIELGARTETFDAEGPVIERGEFAHLADSEITGALERFVGPISQTPPMYSSVKKNGTPLYKLARKGMVVERAAKQVVVEAIEVTKIDLPFVSFSVRCSKGTYIRSIAEDVGQALGCGAYLLELKRTRSGEFTLAEAVSPEAGPDELRGALIPLDEALVRFARGFKEVPVAGRTAELLKAGRTKRGLTVKGFFPFLRPSEVVRFTVEGKLLAIGEFKGANEDLATFDVARVL